MIMYIMIIHYNIYLESRDTSSQLWMCFRWNSAYTFWLNFFVMLSCVLQSFRDGKVCKLCSCSQAMLPMAKILGDITEDAMLTASGI